MDTAVALAMFRETGALLEGHFQLTSGLHSNRYFQCAKVLQHPAYCEKLCADLDSRLARMSIDAVVAPAMGGIVVAQELGRQLGKRSMFTERKDGAMELRRGFVISPNERLLVCEDVITTGGSVGEVIGIVERMQGIVAAVACIVDRSGGRVHFPLAGGGPQLAVLHMDVETWKPEECPLCASGSPAVKPGSRGNYGATR